MCSFKFIGIKLHLIPSIIFLKTVASIEMFPVSFLYWLFLPSFSLFLSLLRMEARQAFYHWATPTAMCIFLIILTNVLSILFTRWLLFVFYLEHTSPPPFLNLCAFDKFSPMGGCQKRFYTSLWKQTTESLAARRKTLCTYLCVFDMDYVFQFYWNTLFVLEHHTGWAKLFQGGFFL